MMWISRNMCVAVGLAVGLSASQAVAMDVATDTLWQEVGFAADTAATASELSANIADTHYTMALPTGVPLQAGGNRLSGNIGGEHGLAIVINQNTGTGAIIQQAVTMRINQVTVEGAPAAP